MKNFIKFILGFVWAIVLELVLIFMIFSGNKIFPWDIVSSNWNQWIAGGIIAIIPILIAIFVYKKNYESRLWSYVGVFVAVLLGLWLYIWALGNVAYQNKAQELIGGQKDAHGCLGPAGYSWCEVKQKCLRVWEEKCEATSTTQ